MICMAGTASLALIGAILYYGSKEESEDERTFRNLCPKDQKGNPHVQIVESKGVKVIEFEFFKKLTNKIYTLHR